jgi:hypothetical protein
MVQSHSLELALALSGQALSDVVLGLELTPRAAGGVFEGNVVASNPTRVNADRNVN